MIVDEWWTRVENEDDWNRTRAADPVEAAERYAEKYCYSYAEFESPIYVEVEGQGTFRVEIESKPVFSAKPVKDEPGDPD